MNRILIFFSIAIFSIFVGSQITEGYLLIPYWKAIPQLEFYDYYSKFGPAINNFYSVLTVISVLIPLGISINCFRNNSEALKYSIASTFFAILIIAFFYFYFKDTNQQFFDAAFNAYELELTLKTYGKLHWMRVICEIISLTFLIFTINFLTKENTFKEIEIYTL